MERHEPDYVDAVLEWARRNTPDLSPARLVEWVAGWSAQAWRVIARHAQPDRPPPVTTRDPRVIRTIGELRRRR